MNKEIESLRLEENTELKLKKNNILTINDLWILKRNSLKEMNFSNNEISGIIVKLQLIGLDLNKRTY